MIAKEAKVCPQCGKELGLLTLPAKIFLGILLIPVALWLYADFRAYFGVTSPYSVADKSSPETKEVKLATGYTFNGYTLSKQEQALLEAFLIDDLIAFIDGRDSLKEMKPIWQNQLSTVVAVNVNANKLQIDYEKNEVAGDQKYRGETLLVSGIVKSIDRSIGENYFLSLQGGSNMFMGPHAKMADGYINYLANLQKGQKVRLVCQGGGMLVGSAMLNKCVPANIIIENLVKTWLANNITKQFSEGNESIQIIVSYSVALTSILPESSDCYETDSNKRSKCMAEINNILKDEKMFELKRNLAAEKLKLDSDKLFGKPKATTDQTSYIEGTPEFQKGESYAIVRNKMIEAGWKPFHAENAQECLDSRCEGRPEMEICAPTGMANCNFLWKKDGKIIVIGTVGEENPVFNGIGDR
jgi:hypothetical protein